MNSRVPTQILGYVITLLNNVCTAASSLLQKRFHDTGGPDGAKFSTFTIVYYNSVIAIPISLVLLVATGELTTLIAFPGLADPSFLFGFIVASGMGLALTYSSFLCTTLNSPLATSVTGNVKDIATTIAGAVMFPGFVATPSNVAGLSLSFVGEQTIAQGRCRKRLQGKFAFKALSLGVSRPSHRT